MVRQLDCYYCDLISATDRAYTPRPAEFDTGSEAPRCAWHWRFLCDHCGEPGHFMARFYCPSSRRLLCQSAGSVRVEPGPFWAWPYRWELDCPGCGGSHPSLDYADYAGVHPWRLDGALVSSRHWLSLEPHLERYPPLGFPRLDLGSLRDEDSDEAWSGAADIWDSRYDERGDSNRRYQSDPVLLEFLGDVGGKRVLDAGSGAGYLSRLLTRRGAAVVGIENARRFYELALGYQEREPLPLEFHHASISSIPFLEGGSFDAAVANYVLMDVRDYEGAISEISRVLKPGGRFVCAISHSAPDATWHEPARDSPRRDDRAAWKQDEYFIRRAVRIWWGDIPPFITFHRPLRDYVAACKRVGLHLRDLEEPEVSEEGVRDLPAWEVRQLRRVPFSYMLRFERVVEAG